MKTFSHLWQYVAKFFLEWEIHETHVVEKMKKHILCSATFFRKTCRLWDNVEKCGGAREAADDVAKCRIRVAWWIRKATRMHTPTLLATRTHRQICDTYCFSTATMVSRTLLSVTLYIHCLSCFALFLTTSKQRSVLHQTHLSTNTDTLLSQHNEAPMATVHNSKIHSNFRMFCLLS